MMRVKDLQQIVKDRYYETDSKRGVHHTYLWFVEEVGELSSAIAKGDRDNQKEELGDVFMWLMTVANLLDIDMESALERFLQDERNQVSK